MNLLLARSADGYLARGPVDSMNWTPAEDKRLFRLLTGVSDQPLLVGGTTGRQLPPLPGREVVVVSRQGLTLEAAAARYPGAWLIGGPTVALAAVEAGLVSRAVICVATHVRLGEGLPYGPLATAMGPRLRAGIPFGTVSVEIFHPKTNKETTNG